MLKSQLNKLATTKTKSYFFVYPFSFILIIFLLSTQQCVSFFVSSNQTIINIEHEIKSAKLKILCCAHRLHLFFNSKINFFTLKIQLNCWSFVSNTKENKLCKRLTTTIQNSHLSTSFDFYLFCLTFYLIFNHCWKALYSNVI